MKESAQTPCDLQPGALVVVAADVRQLLWLHAAQEKDGVKSGGRGVLLYVCLYVFLFVP